jgi:hypothetical protein
MARKPQGPTLKGLIIFLKVGVPALTVALLVAFLELRYVHLISPWYHEEYGLQSLAIFIAVAVTLAVFALYINATDARIRRLLMRSLVIGFLAIGICFAVKYPFLDAFSEPTRKYVRDAANGLALLSYHVVYAAFGSLFTCVFLLLHRRGALAGKIEAPKTPKSNPKS